MWSRASGLSDTELATFDPEEDLVEVRCALLFLTYPVYYLKSITEAE